MKDQNNREKVLLSLKKASSHIQKITKMVEQDSYCIDVIQQINAVIGYLNSAKSKQLAQHLECCFAQGMQSKSGEQRNTLIDEVIQATKMTN